MENTKWVRKLQEHNLLQKAWYMTQTCLLVDINANEINRAFFRVQIQILVEVAHA